MKNPNNEWISVDPIPGTFVINVGDMLQKMTKGLYKSTPHKVVSTGKERFSIPYFYDPGWDQTIPELDIFISEEEKEVLEKTRKYKRIDEGNIEEHTLTIGEYYLAKHSKTFPELYEKFLKQA